MKNPAHYKKFSQRIEEVLKGYREARISEGEYFTKMKELVNDFREGDSGIEYPESIKKDSHAQAFYGVISEMILETNKENNLDNPIAKKFLQFAWFLTKQDLEIGDTDKEKFSCV